MKTKFLVFLLVTAIACISCKTKTTTENTNTMTTTLSPDYAKIIIAKVFIKPGSEADFIATAQSIIEKSNSEEGCLFYQLYQFQPSFLIKGRDSKSYYFPVIGGIYAEIGFYYLGLYLF